MITRRPKCRRHRGVCWAAALLAAGMVATGQLTATAADDDPDPPHGEDDAGGGECTDQQIEGGYENIGGRCQLTGWNWDISFGWCPGQHDAEVGRHGEGTCEPGGGGGSGDGPTGPQDDGADQPPPPWDMPPIEGLGDFAAACHAIGGSLEVADLSTGDDVDWMAACTLDGFAMGGCWAVGDLEPECNVNDPPLPKPDPVNEYPGPTSTTPGQIELPTAGSNDVAAPDDEPTTPAGPVVTIGVGVSLDAAVPLDDGQAPGATTPPGPTTTLRELDVFDIAVEADTREVTSDAG